MLHKSYKKKINVTKQLQTTRVIIPDSQVTFVCLCWMWVTSYTTKRRNAKKKTRLNLGISTRLMVRVTRPSPMVARGPETIGRQACRATSFWRRDAHCTWSPTPQCTRGAFVYPHRTGPPQTMRRGIHMAVPRRQI